MKIPGTPVKIGNLGRVVTGRTPPSSNPDAFGAEYPFLTPADIDGASRYVSPSRFISHQGAVGLRSNLLPADSICVVCIGATIGKICMTDRPSFTNQQINAVVVNEAQFDAKYVYYGLYLLKDDLRAQAGGAATPIINKSVFSEMALTVPPLYEQRRIAGIVSAYDDLIENCQRRIQILEEMVRRLYREWFVHFRYPGHESIPLNPSSLGPLPHGWEVTSLGDLAREVRDNVRKGELDEPTPYVGLEHIPRRSLALDDWEIVTELGSNKLAFKHGDVLFGKIRPYFHKVSVAPFDGVCSADTIVIRARESLQQALVTAAVSCERFVAEASAASNGSKMPRASWDVMKTYHVAIPSESLMEQFSTFVQAAIQEQQVLVGQVCILRQTRDLLTRRLFYRSSAG